MVNYREFGKRLAAARKARGLSQLEIACAISVHPSFYSRVERGFRMVSLITFALIWRRLAFDAGPLLASLPVEVAEPNKRQRQRKRVGAELPAELAGVLSDFDRMMARARNDAGLTQEELASAIGLSSRYIGRIESGYGLPSLPTFARMHRVLNFDANQALARLLGQDFPRATSRKFDDASRVIRASHAAVHRQQTVTSRLWRGGPQLSVSVRDVWQCQCGELRAIVPALTGIEDQELLTWLCIGSVPVDIRLQGDIRLQDNSLHLSFQLLLWDNGTEIEYRQPGLDGSLDTFHASPSAFMASLYGLVVATCGPDIKRLRGILRAVAYVSRQCFAYIRGRSLAAPHE